jgi:hypothetical protein
MMERNLGEEVLWVLWVFGGNIGEYWNSFFVALGG